MAVDMIVDFPHYSRLGLKEPDQTALIRVVDIAAIVGLPSNLWRQEAALRYTATIVFSSGYQITADARFETWQALDTAIRNHA